MKQIVAISLFWAVMYGLLFSTIGWLYYDMTKYDYPENTFYKIESYSLSDAAHDCIVKNDIFISILDGKTIQSEDTIAPKATSEILAICENVIEKWHIQQKIKNAKDAKNAIIRLKESQYK